MGTASNQYETQNIRKPIWKPLQLNKPSIFLISPKRKSSKFNLNSNKSNCKENPILEPTQKTEKGEERSKKWLHKKKSAFGGALFLDFLLFPVQFAALPLFLPLFILLSHEEGRSIYLQNKTEKFKSLSSSSSSLPLSLSLRE